MRQFRLKWRNQRLHSNLGNSDEFTCDPGSVSASVSRALGCNRAVGLCGDRGSNKWSVARRWKLMLVQPRTRTHAVSPRGGRAQLIGVSLGTTLIVTVSEWKRRVRGRAASADAPAPTRHLFLTVTKKKKKRKKQERSDVTFSRAAARWRSEQRSGELNQLWSN